MSGTLVTKLRRDLRASASRFVLMVLALTVSLTAFAAVLFAWSAARRETGTAYASTNPASATIVLDQPIDAARRNAIAAQVTARPEIIDATWRSQLVADIEGVGIPLQVFITAPDDPMRLSTFHIRAGTWPPAPDEILLNQDSLALLGVSVGDVITVQKRALRIAGTVYDPSLSPSPQEQVGRGYLASTGPFDQLKIQTSPSWDRARIVAAAAEIGQWLQREQGLTVREIQVPPPFAHPHQWQADALLAALLAGAAATLALSAVLTATMLGNLFTRHIPQIGIMKAIGARSVRIGRYYLTMVALIALAATILALGPAIWLGRTAVSVFLGLLGIQPESMAAPAWTYPVVVALGLGLPVLLALPPVIRAGRISVRAAIDHHGGTTKPGFSPRLLAWRNRSLLMAIRNTVRRPARFWLSTGLLATAGMVFIAAMSLGDGTEAVVDNKKRQRAWDVDVQLSQPVAVGDIMRATSGIPGVTRVDVLNTVPAGVAGPGQIPVTRTYPDQGHGRVSLTAVPASIAAPKLLQGRWLNPGETGSVVINQVTRNNTVPGVRAGDTVQLTVAGKITTWRVVGIAEEAGHGAGVYTTIDGYAEAMRQPPQGNLVRVYTAGHDEQTRLDTAAAVDRALTASGIAVASADSISRSETVTEGHFGPIVLILLGIALPLGVVGVVGLASTMGANVLDRTREFGVLHAIGARPRTVRRIVVTEGVILALAGYLIGIAPALGLTALLGNGLGGLFFDAPLPYRVSVTAALLWLGIVILSSMLATEAAATRASRITVREALSQL